MSLKHKGGFSLYEVLIVLAIIAILGTFAVPMVNNVITKAKSMKIINDMKVLENSIIQYYYNENDFPTDINSLIVNNYLENTVENINFNFDSNVAYVYYDKEISNADNFEKLDTTFKWSSSISDFSSLADAPSETEKYPVLKVIF
ncbi:general secretion pathway protein G [Marinitoga hydrogenitolerans DSM 16785]|uniref:General secretion pathway protein G n=1 Tax=Marinitoga hydrogenitolerans (strain DSM 16785 / JCM 12826 / AT1271) TaxID=1122195 RepID=A0A1M5AJG6_MARH1|nr:type II secretion system protein [Marinitoga hydrogenitolerans]SHF30274.1 general secretion pathway protein G [Marinitoga hydrogenitolerans DSM 16785]